jgi:hypothetical protein
MEFYCSKEMKEVLRVLKRVFNFRMMLGCGVLLIIFRLVYCIMWAIVK